jgi:hypothetical protein
MFYASHDNNYFLSGIVFPIICLAHMHCTYDMPKKTCHVKALWHRPCSRFVFRAGFPDNKLLIDARVSFLIACLMRSTMLTVYFLGVASFHWIASALF